MRFKICPTERFDKLGAFSLMHFITASRAAISSSVALSYNQPEGIDKCAVQAGHIHLKKI